MVQHINPLNAKLNLFCHLLALLGAHHVLHTSRIRVNIQKYIKKYVRDCGKLSLEVES
jgi:hypothetical protein